MKKQYLYISLSGLLLITLIGCTDNKTDTSAEGETLMELSRQWSDLVGSGNFEEALTFWADDAVLMAPGLPPLHGISAIRGFVEESTRIPGFTISWEPLSAHVSPSGDFAYLIEQNRISFDESPGNTVVQYNKVVTVWRKNADGEWKNVVDIWNEDASQQ